jgi:hypothetical protein
MVAEERRHLILRAMGRGVVAFVWGVEALLFWLVLRLMAGARWVLAERVKDSGQRVLLVEHGGEWWAWNEKEDRAQ